MMMMGVVIGGELEPLDAVAEIALADEAGGLEGGEAAVDGDQVAAGAREFLVDLFDGERAMVMDEDLENLAARPGDAEAMPVQGGEGILELVAGRARHGGGS